MLTEQADHREAWNQGPEAMQLMTGNQNVFFCQAVLL